MTNKIKKRILQVAEKNFFQHGFYRISMDRLVRDLHTSKSTIYKYFNSKEELVRAVLLNINNEINSNLETIINDTELSFTEKLNKVTQFTGNILSRVGQEFLNDLKMYTPDLWDEYQELRQDRLKNLYGKLIENGVDDGIVRSDIQPEFMLLVYTKLTEIAVQPEQLTEFSISNTEAYTMLSRIFLEGTLTKAGRSD